MKIRFFLLILLFGQQIYSQDFSGVHSSQYFPLQNLSTQPADLVRSLSRLHINVASAQIGMMGNMVFNESNFVSLIEKAGMPNLKYFMGSELSLLFMRGRLMLPSVSYKINSKHAVAFSMNMRADGIYSSSNDELINLFKGINAPEDLTTLGDEHFKSIVNGWMEYNLTWSSLIWHNENQSIAGGISIKYLVSSTSGYLNMDGLEVKYDKEKIDYFRVNLNYGMSESLAQTIDDGQINLYGDAGIGLDVGFNYTYLPDHLKAQKDIPYKYKLGFAVTDIGSIKNKSSIRQASYNVSIENVPYSRFSGIESISELVDSIRTSVDIEEVQNGSYKIELPTTISLMGDYCIKPHWFINGYFTYQSKFYSRTVPLIKDNILKINLTPRFETLKWGVYLPITYNNVLNWNTGLALRWRYVFVGSATFVSNIFKSESGLGQFYFGINIPIGHVD